jgi:CheY-like chemotaxis protein
MTGKKSTSIVIIDDDLAMDMLAESLRIRNQNAVRIGSANEALEKLSDILAADLVVLDIIMEWPENQTGPNMGSHSAGAEIFKQIRAQRRDLPILVYSATEDHAIIDAMTENGTTVFLSKWETPRLKELVHRIYRMLGLAENHKEIRPFIVHGHCETEKLALKNYLQNVLHFPEPIILHEQAGLGRTLIEKFEDYADDASIVFVLLTPDDIAAPASDPDDSKRRARQNVIFEMGYFLGSLGRRSGRVLLLYKPPLELPSDLSGVVYIDILNGVEAAGEAIRKEVSHAIK